MNLDLDVAKEIIVGGQNLMFEKSFIEIIEQGFIGIIDVEKIANAVHQSMRNQGWLNPHSGIVFVVDQIPNDSGMLFGYVCCSNLIGKEVAARIVSFGLKWPPHTNVNLTCATV